MQEDVVGRISVAPSDIADFTSSSGNKQPSRSLVGFCRMRPVALSELLSLLVFRIFPKPALNTRS